MAAHDWVFLILFSEFSLPVTFFWYWPLLCSTKLFKPKYVGNKRKKQCKKKYLTFKKQTTLVKTLSAYIWHFGDLMFNYWYWKKNGRNFCDRRNFWRKKNIVVAPHNWVFLILFSEFSLPVTIFWYWPLLNSTKLVNPKYIMSRKKILRSFNFNV